ncbi:MAG: dipeptidase PepE [Thermoanaerobaculia bacterium]
MRLLLISNSTLHGSGYLDHCEDALRSFLGPIRRVLFVPYALPDRAAYAARARERLGRIGYGCDSAHDAADPVAAVSSAEAVFVGGGNTFRLLTTLYDLDLVEPLRRRVLGGAPYVGTSAGSNVACVTIKTTNDMPILEPPRFGALGLVPFNINPHYVDPDPQSRHMGETREERVREFHEENTPPVIGLREGAMLRIEPPRVTLLGVTGARLFRRGMTPEEHLPGARLDFLLEG